MRTLPLVLALLILPVAGAHAQAANPATQDEAQIVQEVLGSTSADPVTPQEAFDTISDFGLTERGGAALDAFSLASQGNLALIRQVGDSNEALLDQTGTGNLAALLQLGSGNVTHAQQNGTGNVFGVRITGSGNRLGSVLEPGVIQNGDGNLYLLDFEGNNQTIVPTVQNGYDNQAVQVGLTAAPFGVQQYGDGMRMIIRHNGAQ